VPSDARHQRDGAATGPRSTGPGPLRAWITLDRDRQLAALAAVLLFITMLLPWYQQNAIVSASKTAPLVSHNLNAFDVFSFVEAAVLLVAVAILVLLYLRAEGRAFNLPGGDGAVVFAAGIWAALLLVLRLFDKPGIEHHGVAANVGVQWGIFFALGAAGLLAYAGSRMRATRRPGPPLLREEEPPTRGAPRRSPAAAEPGRARRSPAPAPDQPAARRQEAAPVEESTTVIIASPMRADTPAQVPGHGRPSAELPAGEDASTGAGGETSATEQAASPQTAAARQRYPPAPPRRKPAPSAPALGHVDQLSFEDSEPEAR
jgi:hypothetical protein